MMSELTLKNALIAIAPSATEAEAITALVDAYGIFAADAEAGVLPLLLVGLDAGKAAMATKLVGMNGAGAGLVKIPQGIISFWGAVALGLSTSFAGATVITPPPHATLAAEFTAAALFNVTNDSTEDDAAELIAGIMYNNAILGGTVTVGVPVFNIL